MKAIFRKSLRIVLDLDATDDPLHGSQEGAFFHGYYLGLARNTRLQKRLAEAFESLRQQLDAGALQVPCRQYHDFKYRTLKSWSRKRQVVGKAEVLEKGNNLFEYCAYSGAEHAVLYITPRSGKTFDQSEFYDRNIRFENNTVKTFDNRIVWADRVNGLVISDNTITQTTDHEAQWPEAHLFDLINCKNIEIRNHRYDGSHHKFVLADAKSDKSLTAENDLGF